MKTRFRRALTGLTMIALLAAMLVVPASADHVIAGLPTTTLGVQPLGIHGNPTCADVTDAEDFLFEFKLDPVESGTYNLSFGGIGGAVEVTAYSTADGQAFDFSFTGGFTAGTVVVKGGPDANFYNYLADHAPGADADTYLHAPVHPRSSRFYGLSHISFCVAEGDNPGSILVEKEYAIEPMGDQISEFTVFDNGTEVGVMDPTVVDATTVLYCLDGLAFGDYRIAETLTPDGFLQAPDQSVTIAEESTCAERLVTPDPDTSVTNSARDVHLEVEKLKLSHDGAGFVVTDVPLAGFTFTLYEGNPADGVVVATSATGADGSTDFPQETLKVGVAYTVCETGVPGGQEGYWTGADCQPVTPELNDNVVLTFYNAPRADLSVGFTDVTGLTSAAITCYDAGGAEVASIELGGTGSLDLDALDLGDYTCDVELRNGVTG